MFERYTDRARRSVVLSQEHARMLGHPAVDVDHVLLGLAAEGEAVAAQALGRLGIDGERARAAVAQARPGGAEVRGHIPFTVQAGRALDAGLRESMELGHNFIGTEHLLLALMTDCGKRPESPCWPVLKACGVTAGDVREAVMILLRGYGDVPAPAPAADDDPRMAAVAALLDEAWRTLEQVRELLGIPGQPATETGERTGS